LYSQPQSLPYGINNIDVLGYASSGLLVHEWGKNVHYVECFKSDMTTRWKKELIITDRNSRIEDVLLHQDTLIAYYSYFYKGNRILKMNAYNASLNIILNAQVIDTINRAYNYDDFDVKTATTFDREFANIYYIKPDFDRNPIIYQHAFTNNLMLTTRSSAAVNNMKQPDLIDAAALGFNYNVFVIGEYQAKNFQNDFNYTSLSILTNNNGLIAQQSIDAGTMLLGTPLVKRDVLRNSLILCGLYSDNPGVKATGTYFIKVNLNEGLLFQIQFLPFTESFITNLSGSQQVKKNDGASNYKPTDLLVKKDGGIILVTESQWRSTEYIGSPGMGAFGVSNSMLITYYHYNDIIVFSLDSAGAATWYQILRKRQASDNNNGLYLSYGLFTGADNMYLFYNDQVLNQQTMSAYIIDTNGNNRREEFFDNTKKNISPIPKMSKQISLDEFVMPSFRRGYFQMIKIILP
jgi:hypothetical protein